MHYEGEPGSYVWEDALTFTVDSDFIKRYSRLSGQIVNVVFQSNQFFVPSDAWVPLKYAHGVVAYIIE